MAQLRIGTDGAATAAREGQVIDLAERDVSAMITISTRTPMAQLRIGTDGAATAAREGQVIDLAERDVSAMITISTRTPMAQLRIGTDAAATAAREGQVIGRGDHNVPAMITISTRTPMAQLRVGVPATAAREGQVTKGLDPDIGIVDSGLNRIVEQRGRIRTDMSDLRIGAQAAAPGGRYAARGSYRKAARHHMKVPFVRYSIPQLRIAMLRAVCPGQLQRVGIDTRRTRPRSHRNTACLGPVTDDHRSGIRAKDCLGRQIRSCKNRVVECQTCLLIAGQP